MITILEVNYVIIHNAHVTLIIWHCNIGKKNPGLILSALSKYIHALFNANASSNKQSD